jgi:DNA modification methylase
MGAISMPLRPYAKGHFPMQPDLAVVSLPVAALVPYAENARTHSPAQVAQIASSIAEFGFVNPVLVDGAGVLVAGHGRVMAAKRLGMTSVPAIRLAHLTEAQARALRLADNQIALNSGWDEALLAAEITRIRDEGTVDLEVLGFSSEALEDLLASIGANGDAPAQGDPDAPAPEPPAQPITRPGDLWRLGRHRLLCGDATNRADVLKLLGGAKPHLMVSDPPYGVGYDPAWRNEAGVSSTARTGKVTNDDRADWREAWALFPGDVAYIWHAGVHARTVIESLEAAGFVVRSQIVWAKPRLVLGRGDYHWQHEPCIYGVRKGATGHWLGARDQTTLWPIGAGDEDMATVHGTQKPVECMRRPMLNNSEPGDVIYEPFCGSGTAIIAAETAERICYAMEIDPGYCDVTIARFEAMTNQPAILDGEDRTFADVTAARAKMHDQNSAIIAMK